MKQTELQRAASTAASRAPAAPSAGRRERPAVPTLPPARPFRSSPARACRRRPRGRLLDPPHRLCGAPDRLAVEQAVRALLGAGGERAHGSRRRPRLHQARRAGDRGMRASARNRPELGRRSCDNRREEGLRRTRRGECLNRKALAFLRLASIRLMLQSSAIPHDVTGQTLLAAKTGSSSPDHLPWRHGPSRRANPAETAKASCAIAKYDLSLDRIAGVCSMFVLIRLQGAPRVSGSIEDVPTATRTRVRSGTTVRHRGPPGSPPGGVRRSRVAPQPLIRLPFSSLLGKVARSAGWGMARCLNGSRVAQRPSSRSGHLSPLRGEGSKPEGRDDDSSLARRRPRQGGGESPPQAWKDAIRARKWRAPSQTLTDSSASRRGSGSRAAKKKTAKLQVLAPKLLKSLDAILNEIPLPADRPVQLGEKIRRRRLRQAIIAAAILSVMAGRACTERRSVAPPPAPSPPRRRVG
jgi:hypothetical protein